MPLTAAQKSQLVADAATLVSRIAALTPDAAAPAPVPVPPPPPPPPAPTPSPSPAPTPTGGFPWRIWTPGPVVVAPSATGKTYYVDGANGNDTNTGLSLTAAFKTIKKTLSLIAAGDTVLIKAGLYREGINLSSSPSGTAAKPITYGSYGDGEVILDGSPKVTGWTLVSGTVYKASLTFVPICIVVNDVPLKQGVNLAAVT